MKRRSILAGVGGATSTGALALALTSLGAGFFACTGEFTTQCPPGTEQVAKGGDVDDENVCRPLNQGGSAGASGSGGSGAGANVGGAAGSNGDPGGGGTSGAGGTGGTGGIGGTGGTSGGAVAGPPGTLDAGFGKGGKADFGGVTVNAVSAFDFQSTEKIVVAGQALFSDSTQKSLVARLDASGNLDKSFGAEGYQPDGGDSYDGLNLLYPRRILSLSSDEIVVASTRDRVAKFKPNGAVDTSFQEVTIGSPGYVADLLAVPGEATGFYLTLYTYLGGSSDGLQIWKISSNGAPDTNYGVPGFEADGMAFDTVLDDRGHITAAYRRDSVRFYGLLKVDTAGDEDNSFGTCGGIGGQDLGVGEVSGVAIDKDGKVLAAGHVDGAARVGRAEKNGCPDSTFGNAGSTVPVASTKWQCIASDDEGRVLVAGTFSGGGVQAVRIARYGQNGFPDVTYGVENSGFATLAQGAAAGVTMCKLDKQGRLLVAGAVRGSAGAPIEPFLMRVWN